MLIGLHSSSLEKDHSLVIPEALRGFISEGVFITRGIDKNLFIMSDQEFRQKAQQLSMLNLADPDVRLLQRLFLGNAAKLVISPEGKVQIPESLISFADLTKEVLFVGQGEYVEVWSSLHWEKQSSLLLNIEANSRKFSHLELATHKPE